MQNENKNSYNGKRKQITFSYREKTLPIRITGALVFKGDDDFFEQLLGLASKYGALIFAKKTGPNHKLKIIEED